MDGTQFNRIQKVVQSLQISVQEVGEPRRRRTHRASETSVARPVVRGVGFGTAARISPTFMCLRLLTLVIRPYGRNC